MKAIFSIMLAGLLGLLLVLSGCISQDEGTLELKITDKPTDLNIQKAMVTISSVEVHFVDTNVDANSESETNWLTVVNESKTFDLIQLKGVTELLGQTNLKTGKYTQVRLNISEAIVTIDGKEYILELPSDKLKLVKGFTIEEGKTTTLTLDFDAQESIIEKGTGGYSLKPTIKILEE